MQKTVYLVSRLSFLFYFYFIFVLLLSNHKRNITMNQSIKQRRNDDTYIHTCYVAWLIFQVAAVAVNCGQYGQV